MDNGTRCSTILDKIADSLAEAGFLAAREENRVVSFFGVENQPLVFAYVAECQDGELVVDAGVKGVDSLLSGLDCEKREAILRELLRIPNTFNVSISMADDSLAIRVIIDRGRDPHLTALSGFALAAQLTSWLSEQAERAARGEEVEPFEPEG